MAKAKEDAVANSQQMLEEDAKKFEDYLQVRETHCVFLPNRNGYFIGFRDDVKNTIWDGYLGVFTLRRLKAAANLVPYGLLWCFCPPSRKYTLIA